MFAMLVTATYPLSNSPFYVCLNARIHCIECTSPCLPSQIKSVEMMPYLKSKVLNKLLLGVVLCLYKHTSCVMMCLISSCPFWIFPLQSSQSSLKLNGFLQQLISSSIIFFPIWFLFKLILGSSRVEFIAQTLRHSLCLFSLHSHIHTHSYTHLLTLTRTHKRTAVSSLKHATTTNDCTDIIAWNRCLIGLRRHVTNLMTLIPRFQSTSQFLFVDSTQFFIHHSLCVNTNSLSVRWKVVYWNCRFVNHSRASRGQNK